MHIEREMVLVFTKKIMMTLIAAIAFIGHLQQLQAVVMHPLAKNNVVDDSGGHLVDRNNDGYSSSRHLSQLCKEEAAWHPNYNVGWTNGYCQFKVDCNSPVSYHYHEMQLCYQ